MSYASRIAAGKLFHMTGPATEKALSPNFVRPWNSIVKCAEHRAVTSGSLLHDCTESMR